MATLHSGANILVSVEKNHEKVLPHGFLFLPLTKTKK